MKRTSQMWFALLLALATAISLSACREKPSSIPPPPNLSVPTASLLATPTTIKHGQSATLTWQTQNATEVMIDPIGRVAERGSEPISPGVTTLYRLTAKGPRGTAQASITVTVTD
jgi:hypothetical protein